jgi:hypothetical protein
MPSLLFAVGAEGLRCRVEAIQAALRAEPQRAVRRLMHGKDGIAAETRWILRIVAIDRELRFGRITTVRVVEIEPVEPAAVRAHPQLIVAIAQEANHLIETQTLRISRIVHIVRERFALSIEIIQPAKGAHPQASITFGQQTDDIVADQTLRIEFIMHVALHLRNGRIVAIQAAAQRGRPHPALRVDRE